MSDEGLVYIAAFPKSGSTWLRAFIDAYHHDRAPDINAMFGTVTDQALRWYQACSPDPVGEMPAEELALLHPAAMLNLRNSLTWTPKLVKTHHANIQVSGCRLIVPQLTKRVVYLVRDPRDVVKSYARHFGLDVETAADRMTDSRVALFDAQETGKAQHWTTSWARHVASYAEADDLEVTVVKYEQLREDPVRYFSWILQWIGVEPDAERVQRAVDHCALDRLRAQERRSGFKECSRKADAFFGQGATAHGAGLPDSAREQIEAHAGDVMQAFGYLGASSAAA